MGLFGGFKSALGDAAETVADTAGLGGVVRLARKATGGSAKNAFRCIRCDNDEGEKCSECGNLIHKNKAYCISGDNTHYFCSEKCAKKYDS